jgi:hypothetical protein
MMRSATQRSPSFLALAAAWALALASDVGWSIGLYNYDGETGATPPPSIWATTVWASIVATVLVAVAWAAWRLRRPTTIGFWVFLFAAFAAKGLLGAALEGISVLLYTAAPFTLAGADRGEALSVATALVSGVVVALIVRAIDAKRTSVTSPIEAHFD